MSVKPPESFIRGGERTGSNYTPSSLLCDCVCVCVCRGLWGVGGGGDGGGVGEGGEEVNTRSGMTQLCGGLACNTHSCVFVCVCVWAHAPVTASPIFSNHREKQKQTILPNYSQPQSSSLFFCSPCFASSPAGVLFFCAGSYFWSELIYLLGSSYEYHQAGFRQMLLYIGTLTEKNSISSSSVTSKTMQTCAELIITASHFIPASSCKVFRG